jgi:hypothetical protein
VDVKVPEKRCFEYPNDFVLRNLLSIFILLRFHSKQLSLFKSLYGFLRTFEIAETSSIPKLCWTVLVSPLGHWWRYKTCSRRNKPIHTLKTVLCVVFSNKHRWTECEALFFILNYSFDIIDNVYIIWLYFHNYNNQWINK